MKVELHPEADEEFAAQVDYYEDQEVGLGLKFYHEVIAHLDWIAANATVPRLRIDHRRVNLTVFPFYIAYVVDGDRVWVLAVASGQKRPHYWTERLKDR